MNLRLLLPLLLGFLLSSLVPDAEAGRRSRKPAESETPNLIIQALALAKEDRLEALSLLEGYLNDGQDTQLLQLSALHAGEQRRLMGDLEGAKRHFQWLRQAHPGVEPAIIGMSLVLHAQGSSGNVLASLELIGDQGVPDSMNADRYRILALAAMAENAPLPEQQELAEKALTHSLGDPGVAIRVRLDLGSILPVDAPGMEDYQAGDTEALARARAALEAGNHSEAMRLTDAMEAQFPDSALRLDATWIRLRASAGDPFKATKVGVLLPLTGTYGPAGLQLKDSLDLALRAGGSPVKFIYRDTTGDPEIAVETFKDLVLTEGVAAVVGPLLKEVAVKIAAEAQAAQVPLVALSQVGGLTESGPWIFRGVLTIEQQVRALVDHVMGPMGLQTFVVLAPDNSYGHGANDAFSHLVTERGGEVKRAVFYDPQATDFRPSASELGLKDYESPERKEEITRLRKKAEAEGVDLYKVVLPPLMDFDAIFIPDNARRVPMVASSLAYEEFSIGAFSPRGAMDPVPLIGLNGWHHPSVASQGGQYTRNAIFVDAFDASDEDPGVQAYVSSFQEELGRKPVLLESMVYDVGCLVVEAFSEVPDDRSDLRQQIASAQLEQAITGGLGFGATREVERELRVFRIGKEGIEPHKEPEEMLPTP